MKIMINLLGFSGFDSQSIYAENMVSRLLSNGPNFHFYIVCEKHMVDTFNKHSNVDIISLNYKKNWFSRILFLNTVIPFFFFIKKCKVLYNPTTIFPILLTKYSFVTIHDLFYKNESKGPVSWFMNMMYFFAKYSKKIITVSNTVKKELIKNGFDSEKIVVALNALPAVFNDYKYGENFEIPKEDYIVYVGMYRKRKNIEKLIESMAYDFKLKLVMVGSVVEKKNYLLDYAKTFNVEDKIIFSGKVSNSVKNKIISNSQALIMSSFEEGFGFPVLEAQKLEVPVCLSDIDVFREVAGDSVLYFNPNDPKDMSYVIGSLILDEKLKKSLVERGLENVKRFDWQKSAEIILNNFIV